MTDQEALGPYKELPCGRRVPRLHPGASGCKLLEVTHRLKQYLSEKKLRFTEQRRKLAEAIVGHADHLSAQDIVQKVQREHPDIGAATVYRNIKILCDAGILTESYHSKTGVAVYEVSGDAHDHLICLDCGEVIEFSDMKVERWQKKMAKSLDFKLEDSRQILHARCNLLKSRRS